MFLSEIIRSRRTSIRRAAEISSRVLYAIQTLKNEDEVLGFLADIEKEFEEFTVLKMALHFGYDPSDIVVYEQQVREFAAELFKQDMVMSSEFLQTAARPGATVQELCVKYPAFCSYLLSDSEVARQFSQVAQPA